MQQGNTIVLADAHLEALDDELTRFLEFLRACQKSGIHSLYILGDLFNIWLGTAKMELPHQLPLVESLHELRDQGIHLAYVEGNRDYFLAPRYLAPPFHEIAKEYTTCRLGQRTFYFSHGDLVNLHDTQYRKWRRFSRNPLIFKLFTLLPRKIAVAFVHKLERSFRQSNQRHKSSFPTAVCREYAESLWNQGYETIVLGHFHEQRTLSSSDNSAQQLFVLPAWKDGHRYLSISAEGSCVFHNFSG